MPRRLYRDTLTNCVETQLTLRSIMRKYSFKNVRAYRKRFSFMHLGSILSTMSLYFVHHFSISKTV